KCNFCTHRLELSLQPSCVAVCPEQAIIAGDLDDPNSQISELLGRFPVQVRKPEKGTKPKLFYIEADEASLVPTRASAEGGYLWRSADQGSQKESNGETHRTPLAMAEQQAAPRRVYDVRPRRPSWGWHVAGYTWTKSIAAGAFLAVPAAWLL